MTSDTDKHYRISCKVTYNKSLCAYIPGCKQLAPTVQYQATQMVHMLYMTYLQKCRQIIIFVMVLN